MYSSNQTNQGGPGDSLSAVREAIAGQVIELIRDEMRVHKVPDADIPGTILHIMMDLTASAVMTVTKEGRQINAMKLINAYLLSRIEQFVNMDK